MARKKIREYHAKKMMFRELGISSPLLLIGPEDDLDALPKKYHWLTQLRLVAKPDQLFGKRGKHGLVLVNKPWEEVKSWIREKMGKKVRIGKHEGELTHFIVEPFFEHSKEYYLAIRSTREGEEILFSEFGGVDVEENWDKVISILPKDLDKLSEPVRGFAQRLIEFFREYDFTYLEINPLAFDGNKLMPLDTVAELDGYAEFKNKKKWRDIEFPEPFGKLKREVEKKVEELDEKSTASLKLTILNPKGRIWLMVAGGGASVIYADTVVDMGLKEELANYGEYSGNPTREEMREYARAILEAMLSNGVVGKFLLIGGGVANFTDVAATFKGIIDAIEEKADKLKEQKVMILVRRGGPNSEEGLKMFSSKCKELGLDVELYGEDVPLTFIVRRVVEEVGRGV